VKQVIWFIYRNSVAAAPQINGVACRRVTGFSQSRLSRRKFSTFTRRALTTPSQLLQVTYLTTNRQRKTAHVTLTHLNVVTLMR